MNPIARILKAFTNTKQTGKQLLDYIVSRWVGQNVPVTNLAETPTDYVKRGFMANNFVYQAVTFITSKAARVPIKLYKVAADGELEEVRSHPILGLLHKPNKYQGSEEFTNQALGYKLITGNSYIYTPKLESGANAGKPYELQVMPAHMVEVVSAPNWMEPIGGYRIQFAPDILFKPEEVIHFRYPAYDYELGDYYGMSPLKPLLNIVNKSNANTQAAKSSFDNMGAAGIVTDEAIDQAQGISAEQAAQLESRWKDKFEGPTKKGKLLITVGKLRYQQIGLSPVDLNMIRDHEETRRDICAAYGLPSVLFNDTAASTRDNIQQARKIAWTDAIQPILDSYVDELNRALVPLWGDPTLVLKADYSAVPEMQADLATMVAWMKDAYWMRADEKRKLMGLDADPLMEQYFMPTGVIPYEEMPPLSVPNDEG